MRISTIAAGLASAQAVLGFDYQLPLVDEWFHHAVPAGAIDDEPSFRAELLSLHKSLVELPSISGDEAEVGNFLVNYLTGKGWVVDIQFVAPRDSTPDGKERYNVAAWRDRGVPNPKLLVTSHFDVVPPHIPYGIEAGNVSEDTVITGRGSVDAKGSVAAMIVAVDELVDAGEISGDDVMLVFVVGEEVSGDGMRAFSDFIGKMDPPVRFAAAIFGEPTENKLACGHKGGLFCGVTAKGVPGHSGYPWLGKSANELMVRAMARIIDTDLGSSDRFGNTTVNLGRIDGGVAANVIPEHSFLDLAVRVAIGPENGGADIVRDKIQKILDDVDPNAFTFDCTHGYGFVEAECEVDGFETIVVNYGTDIPNLAGDHTRYLYGPGSILVAHGAHENLTVGDLEASVGGYQKLILHALQS